MKDGQADVSQSVLSIRKPVDAGGKSIELSKVDGSCDRAGTSGKRSQGINAAV